MADAAQVEDALLAKPVADMKDIAELMKSTIVLAHRSSSYLKPKCLFCPHVYVRFRPLAQHEHNDAKYNEGKGRRSKACKPEPAYVARHNEVLQEVRKRQKGRDERNQQEDAARRCVRPPFAAYPDAATRRAADQQSC